jgi:uncharacterized protein (TIGR03435 family)
LVCLALALGATAQSVPRPEFEVVSLKLSQSTAPARLTFDPGTWSCLNCRLFDLFGHAYKVFEYQIVAPDWTKSATFDVVAKLPPGFKRVPFSIPADQDEFAVRLQALLEGRFAMKVHRETRNLSVYELVIAPEGPKLQELAEAGPPAPPGPPVDEDGFPNIPGGDGMRVLPDRGRIQFRWQSMANFAHFLSTQVDRPVLDNTGLKAHYALKLSWYKEASSVTDSPSGPTIFESLVRQLGLRLQAKKSGVEMLVVDTLQKVPLEN